MSPRALLFCISIQFAALLIPIAAGLAGVVSGGLAGLGSIVGWFAVGLPLSYAAVDTRLGRSASGRQPRIEQRVPTPESRVVTAA